MTRGPLIAVLSALSLSSSVDDTALAGAERIASVKRRGLLKSRVFAVAVMLFPAINAKGDMLQLSQAVGLSYEESIKFLNATRTFRDKISAESFRVRAKEEELANPQTMRNFEQFVARLEQQMLSELGGRAEFKNRVAERFREERLRLVDYLAAQSVKAQRAALIEQCWGEKGRYLTKAGNADVEVVKVYRQESRNTWGGVQQGSIFTVVMIAAINTTNSTILKPSNQKYWGAFGTSMADSFGNRYKLIQVTPEYIADERPGIRPGETKIFELKFIDEPLRNAKSILITIEPGA